MVSADSVYEKKSQRWGRVVFLCIWKKRTFGGIYPYHPFFRCPCAHRPCFSSTGPSVLRHRVKEALLPLRMSGQNRISSRIRNSIRNILFVFQDRYFEVWKRTLSKRSTPRLSCSPLTTARPGRT
ncbi:UNVERIFIED_CONTAM: hypothetical protein FKN15_059721 [Acipenser sinensis]